MTLSKPKSFKAPKEFKAEYLKELDATPFEPEIMPGINAPLLSQDIAIQI